MVTDSRAPRQCTVHACSFTTAFALTLLFTAASLAAQDRVVLFDRVKLSVSGSPLPFEIREFEIAEGGRRWSFVRTVTLPGHFASTPVLLADGSRLVWLAESTDSAVLVQYEFATARASIVNVGSFHRSAVVVADPSDLRVAIVGPERVTFLDQRLQPYSVTLSGLITSTAAIAAANGYVVVQRSVSTGTEAVVINAQTAEVVRSIALPDVGSIRVTRDAQRFYHVSGFAIDMRSLTTGQLLARAIDSRCCWSLFELDESRELLIHGVREWPSTRIVARDARTLALVGELGFGVFNQRVGLQLKQTGNEAAVLVFSQAIIGFTFEPCRDDLPRIDVFDGRTFELVRQVDWERCTTVLALPPR